MAELDFSHRVSQIPAQEQLPAPIKRQVSAETSTIPDYSGASRDYAAASNWMSTLGSYVATQASNKIAQKIGGELGKNPQGDLGIPLTEFDKTMAKSYETQAQSTLGVQAQKLISQSNLELASQPRIDASMISKSQMQVGKGLEKIFSLAPDSMRPDMEYRYGSVMINQSEQLAERMLENKRQIVLITYPQRIK
jgi:hypothetical protein